MMLPPPPLPPSFTRLAWSNLAAQCPRSGALACAAALLWRLAEPPRLAAPARHPLVEIRDGVWRPPLLRPGPAVSVLAAATMVATLVAPSGAMAGLAFFLFGLGPIIWTITSTTLRQSITPGAMLGRAGSVFLTVNTGARPIGAALGGLVGASFGEAACLWLALAGFVLQAWLIFASSLSQLQLAAAGSLMPAPLVFCIKSASSAHRSGVTSY